MIASQFPLIRHLNPSDSAAAVLTTEDGRYVMQRRDDKAGIFYPGHLGLFGGACEEGESYEQTAVRELEEELALPLAGRLKFLSQTTLGFEPLGFGRVERVYFSATLTNQDVANIRLGEGQGVELVEATQLLTAERVMPYDAFVIWLHCNATAYPPTAIKRSEPY